MKLESTPMNTKGYEDILRLAETGEADSFDLYYGLFVHNPNAVQEVNLFTNSVSAAVFHNLYLLAASWNRYDERGIIRVMA